MRCLCVLCAILLVSNVFSTNKIISKRCTQKNQPWIWKDRDDIGSNNNNFDTIKSTTESSSTTESNPSCKFADPPKPNFSAPGRRISTAKCLEYIWERKNRVDKNIKVTNCNRDLIKTRGSNGPYFVVGGQDALPGEYPHMGGVGWRTREGTWLFKCGCSLISSKFTITAAHCTKSPRDTKLENTVPEVVRLGDKNIIDAYFEGLMVALDVKILRIIVHPQYAPPKKYFDIALMEVEEVQIFTSNIQPACLWSQFDTSKLGSTATLTGWGVVETATKKTSPKLQAAVVDIIHIEQCDALLRSGCNRHWCGIQEHQICGGKLSGGVDACQGDSGGPLQVKIPLPESSEGSMHFLIGVTSFGIGCGLPDLPGVYTRVSSFIDWIENILNQPWMWREGNVNQQLHSAVASNKLTATTERISTVGQTNCQFDDPPKPNFRAPGRKISEAKCIEYIWERKNREDKNTKIANCRRKLSETQITFHTSAIGGIDALPGEFPHMGGVGWRAREGTWIFKCGCSLISSKFTLTAAHCSKSPRDTSVQNSVPEIVRLGDKNIIDVFSNGLPPRDAKILRIIVHPTYSPPKKYFDIALMEIEEIKSFTSNVQPACLWSQFDTSRLGTSATLTGWGVVETATKKTSPVLQAAVVDIIDSKNCDALLRYSCNRHWCGIQDHQICGGKLSGGVDACQGDSGGPLQVKIPLKESSEGSMHYIIGVTSFGIGCALPDSPGVYTRVSTFIDWIENIVWPGN